METETRTAKIRPANTAGWTVIEQGQDMVVVDGADLRAIAQYAYDQHGICADPFATPGSAEASTFRGVTPPGAYVDEVQQLPSEPGRCRCPFPESCSDTAHRGGRSVGYAMSTAHNVGVRA